MNLIFLGAPGAGKGTQAALLSSAIGVPAVSTGDIIRNAIKSGSEKGKEFMSYTDKGQLVPDDVVFGLVGERLSEKDCENGFILDGFPRNIAQAEFLEKSGVRIDKVICIDVTDEDIVRRMAGRRYCPVCQTTYHLEHRKPKVEGRCDLCNEELIQRKDDLPETVLERLRVYHENTEPLIGFYSEKLIRADGTLPKETIASIILGELKK